MSNNSQNYNQENPINHDELYGRVLELIIMQGFIAVPMLQREFNIGSSRATQILQNMEKEGLITESLPSLWDLKDPNLKAKHDELKKQAKERLALEEKKIQSDKNLVRDITFTRDQYYTLLKAVYLGNWMANAYRCEDTQEDFEKLESYIFSFAPKFGFSSYVDTNLELSGEVSRPSQDFEDRTNIHDYHEFYDEKLFWEELPLRLVSRDMQAKYGLKEIEKMSLVKKFDLSIEYEEKWQKEIEKHGITRLQVSEK